MRLILRLEPCQRIRLLVFFANRASTISLVNAARMSAIFRHCRHLYVSITLIYIHTSEYIDVVVKSLGEPFFHSPSLSWNIKSFFKSLALTCQFFFARNYQFSSSHVHRRLSLRYSRSIEMDATFARHSRPQAITNNLIYHRWSVGVPEFRLSRGLGRNNSHGMITHTRGKKTAVAY